MQCAQKHKNRNGGNKKLLRPAGCKALPVVSKGTLRQFLDYGPERAPLPRTWSHSPAHLASPREGQVLTGPGNLEAHASAQRRSLPRPAHVSHRHGASSSLAARPAATDLRPQQSSRAPRDWQGSTPSTQALRTRPLHGLHRGGDPEDQAIAGSVQRSARMGLGGVCSPGKGRAGEAGPLPVHSLVPATVHQRKTPPRPPALPRPVSCGAHRKEEVHFRSEIYKYVQLKSGQMESVISSASVLSYLPVYGAKPGTTEGWNQCCVFL
ncbi:uncharacterized protein LOC143439819 [Arvicanthis niloticus]|uniref:uncharacterized protein LOC143311488 n=1 Tax=Arvicanthis niloticus TaxID=61156 RepID=UPI00402BF092